MKMTRKKVLLPLSLVLLFGYFPGSAMAGCLINYSFENNSSKNIKIFWLDVMSKGGIWKNILTNWNMGAGTKHQDTYRAAFSCNAKRRYRFQITDSRTVGSFGSCTSFYHPSATGWTTSTDIDFGDLSLHCNNAQQATNQPSQQPANESPSQTTTQPTSSAPPESQSGSGESEITSSPNTGVIAPPGTLSTAIDTPPSAGTISAPVSENALATSGQCLVSSTRYYPNIRLRCGVSIKDSTSRVADDFLSNCPLVAGDRVNIQIDEGKNKLQITGRISGGQWCNKTFQPGYYAGPCSTEKNGKQKITLRTLFYQGGKIVGSIIPGQCKPVMLRAGIYRVISEHRVSGGGLPSRVTLQEGGLRLEGQTMIGDVTGMLSLPIEQK